MLIKILIIVIVAILVAIVLFGFAERKGKKDPAKWFVAGFAVTALLGLLAIFWKKKKP